MSVHIKCDRCGTMDDHHWRNLRLRITRGSYASVSAPGYSDPWDIDRHICGYCASTLRDWWNRRDAQSQEREPT